MAACRICGGDLPVRSGRGRPRTRCESCAPPAKSASPPKLSAVDPAPDSGPGRIEAATLAELTAAARADTSAGVEALHLAKLLDAGGYTAAGAATLSRARREALAAAMSGARPAEDGVSELERRREAKARAAGA